MLIKFNLEKITKRTRNLAKKSNRQSPKNLTDFIGPFLGPYLILRVSSFLLLCRDIQHDLYLILSYPFYQPSVAQRGRPVGGLHQCSAIHLGPGRLCHHARAGRCCLCGSRPRVAAAPLRQCCPGGHRCTRYTKGTVRNIPL